MKGMTVSWCSVDGRSGAPTPLLVLSGPAGENFKLLDRCSSRTRDLVSETSYAHADPGPRASTDPLPGAGDRHAGPRLATGGADPLGGQPAAEAAGGAVRPAAVPEGRPTPRAEPRGRAGPRRGTSHAGAQRPAAGEPPHRGGPGATQAGGAPGHRRALAAGGPRTILARPAPRTARGPGGEQPRAPPAPRGRWAGPGSHLRPERRTVPLGGPAPGAVARAPGLPLGPDDAAPAGPLRAAVHLPPDGAGGAGPGRPPLAGFLQQPEPLGAVGRGVRGSRGDRPDRARHALPGGAAAVRSVAGAPAPRVRRGARRRATIPDRRRAAVAAGRAPRARGERGQPSAAR